MGVALTSGLGECNILLRILDLLEAATKPADLALPGFRFHPLKGGRKGEYAVSVTGNWRITFEFDNADAMALRLEKALGTSAEMWCGMQAAVDLWTSRQHADAFAAIKRLDNSSLALAA